MSRRITSQVHQQVSRLMRGGFIENEPLWYRAVLENPPLSLPAKAPPLRSAFDQRAPPSESARLRPHSTRPLPIYYLEDDIRRQFFKDHPFETYRPTSLVENERIDDPHPITGKIWVRLRQRGRNPHPEDAILFALNLYKHHNLSLSDAYASSVAQFRSLRSEHYIATAVAVKEAEALGSDFGPSEIERAHEIEKKSIASWERQAELDEGAIAARKRWKALVDSQPGANQWTEGVEYVRLWKEGIRPNYMPHLTMPVPEHDPMRSILASNPGNPDTPAGWEGLGS